MASQILNFNVGVLGHVDSGKTSLAKALSTVASTASFDKNPQSKERGITLDLGFSSFCVPAPDHLKSESQGCKLDSLQFTLVDCPGHASLIKTIIGGAQIIDLMMLVVDVTKGIQTQTAECLIIGEITCRKMIVVFNKIDLLPQAKRQAAIEKMTKRLHKTLESTPFAGCPVVPIAAKPGGPEAPEVAAEGIEELISTLRSAAHWPQRNTKGPLVYAVDHCFSIRGQGTVMTGTVLSGSVSINDTVEIPVMKITKKVKSMQMFRKPVDKAIQGDRVGLCVTQFDPKQLERGLVCSIGALPTICAAIISVNKISYFKGCIATKAKFHVTMGHETIMAKVAFFGSYSCDKENLPPGGITTKDTTGPSSAARKENGFDFTCVYKYQDELIDVAAAQKRAAASGEEILVPQEQYAILEFETVVTCPRNSIVIGSRLDTDIHSNTCRLAFHGRIVEAITDPKYADTVLPRVMVYKDKSREGTVERKQDEQTVICRALFKKESKIELFLGLKVTLSTGEHGVIEGSFGQSGKFKVRIPGGFSSETALVLSTKGVKKGKGKNAVAEAAKQELDTECQTNISVLLNFRRYVYDPKKKMMQT